MGKMERLDKILALHGVGSRKEAGLLVRRGSVLINGVQAARAEQKVDPERDSISVEGKELTLRKHLYIMMNKPSGVLSATRDPRAETVVDLLPPKWRRKGIFPAGRLDKDTRGLLILTDDGDFAHRMLAPKSHVWKLYEAELDGPVGPEERERFREGISIGDRVCLPAELYLPEGKPSSLVRVRIREGKFHQVKRMFGAVGREVTALKRLRIGNLPLDGSLKPGECRLMTEEEKSSVFEQEAENPGPSGGITEKC